MFDFTEHATYTSNWISNNFPPIEDPEHFYNITDHYDYENDDFYNVDRDYDLLDYLYSDNNTITDNRDYVNFIEYDSSSASDDDEYYE